jgi:hypothetical protein
MAKLLTGTRIYGTGTVDTQLFVSGTNSATSTTTGALQVVGGVGVGGNLYVGGTIFGGIISGTASTSTNADNVKTVLQTSSSSHYLAFVDSNNSTAAYEALYTTSSFVINPQSGNVGIGTSTATYALTIVNSSPVLSVGTLGATGGSIYLGNSNHGIQRNSNNVLLYTTAGAVYLSSNGAGTTNQFALLNNGNVGIGTNSPSYPLHLLTTSTTSAAFRNSASTTTQILIGNTAGDTTIRTAGSGDSFIFSDTSKYLAFGTGATERLRITANGGISFGGSGTAYGVSGQILQSNGDAAPTWISTGSLAAANATTATHLSGGTAGQVPYQTAPGVTSFYGPGTAGNVLVSNGTSAPSYNNTLTLTGTTAATNATSGALQIAGGVGINNNLFVTNNINAVNGQFVSTRANNATTDAGQILLNGATGNRIDFNVNGVAGPAFTTRSAGTKLVLYPAVGASAVDFALGIESNTMWFSTYDNAGGQFKWYHGITNTMVLAAGGNLTLVGDLAVNGGDITTTQTTFNLINTTATTVNFAGAATTLTMGSSGSGTTNVRNNLTVSGNLTVQGTTTIVDSTVTNIADPIITLGGGSGNTAPTADDNKDRGVAFKWVSNAGTTSTGFFGYDDSTGYLTYVPTATITNEVVSGTKGAMDVNLAGGTAMSIVYQSAADTTAFLAAGSSGFLLQTNGTGSAPTWVSASGVSAGSATNADNIRTIAQTASATYYPTFVDSNNATNAYESVYTTSSFSINPATSAVTIGGGFSAARLSLGALVSNRVLSIYDDGTNWYGLGIAGSEFRNLAPQNWTVGTYTRSSDTYTERVRVDSAGNVNIGTFTTSISKKFTVVGEGNFSDASNIARLYMGFGTIPTTGGTGAYIYNNDNSPLAFGTWNTERMRIDTLGTVGIGETTPATYATTGSLVITNTTFRPEIALRTTNAIGGTTAIKLGATSSIPQGGAVISSYISAVSGQPTDLIFSLVTSGVLTERLRITSNGGIAFSGTNTYGTSGFVLKSNGDAAPTWVDPSTLASASATNADNIRTVAQTANASYFPAFVDSNNASNAYELVYTTSSFSINPATGFVGIGSQDGASPLNVKALSTLSGTINSFQKVLTTQAAGGLGNNVYRSEWRRRRAAGTDWTTHNIHDGIWVDSSFTTPGTDTRAWWERDPNTPSQSWGDQATTWMFHNSSALFLTGGSSQLNTGFTNRLNVTGSIVAGSASSTNGSIILQGQYGTGSITNLGTEYSSGGPVLGYGVYPSNTATGAFFSSSGLALTRGAYTIAGNVHRWYVGSSQTLAIGSTATLSLAMSVSSSGINLPTAASGNANISFDGTTFTLVSNSSSAGLVLSTNSTERLRITPSGGVSFGASGTAYGSSGQILQSNDNAPPTWTALSSRTVGTSTQVNTVLQTASASYFPTFVDSNNASATAEALYTTSSFQINASNGQIDIGTTGRDYQPSSGGSHTLRLNAANTSSIGFHDSGSTIGNLKFSGNYGFEIGAYDGLYGPHNTILHGNVGIGTTSPQATLHLGASVANSSDVTTTRFIIKQSSNDTEGGLYIERAAERKGYYLWINPSAGSGDGLTFTRNNNGTVGDVLHLDRDGKALFVGGNVGIGTTNPLGKLQLSTTGDLSAYKTYSGLGNTGAGDAIFEAYRLDGPLLYKRVLDIVALGDSTNSRESETRFFTTNLAGATAERLRISGAGNVSIGTTSTTNKFEVAGTAGQLFSVSDSFTGTIFSVNDVSGIPSIEVLDTGLVKLAQYNGAVAIGTGTITSSTAELSVYGMLYTLGSQGEIRASSEITAYFSSDRRLKENIKLIENPITIIDQIRGVTFDWTDEHMARRGGEDGYFVRKHDIGVIAQEVQAVLPELVGTREDGYLAVKYEKMVPLLIEAIKAQQATIDSLVKDLAEVKEFISQLKNKNGI